MVARPADRAVRQDRNPMGCYRTREADRSRWSLKSCRKNTILGVSVAGSEAIACFVFRVTFPHGCFG